MKWKTTAISRLPPIDSRKKSDKKKTIDAEHSRKQKFLLDMAQVFRTCLEYSRNLYVLIQITYLKFCFQASVYLTASLTNHC